MIYKSDFALDPTCHLMAGDRCMQQIICFPISNFGTRPTPDFHSMCVVRMSKVGNQVESFTNVMRGIFLVRYIYIIFSVIMVPAGCGVQVECFQKIVNFDKYDSYLYWFRVTECAWTVEFALNGSESEDSIAQAIASNYPGSETKGRRYQGTRSPKCAPNSF